MAIPYRQFTQFYTNILEQYITDGNPNQKSAFTTVHYDYGRIGDGIVLTGAPPKAMRYNTILMPSEEAYVSATSLDSPMKAVLQLGLTLHTDTSSPAITSYDLIHGILDDLTSPKEWDPALVEGQHYDGTNDWENYLQTIRLNGGNYHDGRTANLPETVEIVFKAADAGFCYCYEHREPLWREGFAFYASNYGGGQPDATGEYYYVGLAPEFLKLYYWNAVVNSMSRYYCGTAGGVQVVLTGLGFKNSDTEIDEGGPAGGGWNDLVDKIYFEGLQGQTTVTLTQGVDFIVDSNSQITITMPAMPEEGTYEIRLKKQNMDLAGAGAVDVDSYAGDARCDANGAIREGTRITFLVSDSYVPRTKSGPGGPIPIVDVVVKDPAGDKVTKHYSVIDVRTPSAFYEGRITGISSITRGIDDKTGLCSITDMTLRMANEDKEFSKILAQYFIKNQDIDVHRVWRDEPESWKDSVMKGIVNDYALSGGEFLLTLKDMTQKYFKIKVPFYTCTEDEYSDIHDSAKGKYMPEAIGLNQLASGIDALGAIEARYIDTVNFKYLAARRTLKEITAVYADGAVATGWTISYEDGGRTYITFAADQQDKKITYDCKGYMDARWNSDDGYIQNPAYVLLYTLIYILKVPIERIDLDSFDTLATRYQDLGADTAGKLIIQEEKTAEEVMQKLLWTAGAKFSPDKEGLFKVERKDISTFSSNVHVFDQFDLLQSAHRDFGLLDTANYAKSRFDHFPTTNHYKGAIERSKAKSIEDFEAEIEPSQAWDFPWTTSSAFTIIRLDEELMKRSYGDKKIRFSLPIRFIDDLDVLTNFRFQDPFGLSRTGAGEVGRYYYVESMTVDFQNETIHITGIDLEYLLRQFFILGDSNTIAQTWALASESDRTFGYLCNSISGKFADGEEGKILGISE